MKHWPLFCFLVGLLAWTTGAWAGGPVPIYRGFPVYPPERVIGLDGDDFDLPLRNLEVMRKAFEAHEKANQGKAPRFPPRKKLNKLTAEFGQAVKYLKREAEKQGWRLIHRDMYKDGGSLAFVWGRLGKTLDVVHVSVWSGGMFVGFQTGVMTGSQFGTLSYQFWSRAAPWEHETFPLCPQVTGPKAFKRSKVQNGTRFVVKTKTCRHPRDQLSLVNLPELEGWKARRSPLLRGGKLWEKNEALVLEEAKPNSKIAFTFVSPDRRAEVLARYPEQVEREETVDKGCLIVEGRFLRRPYRVRLKGGKLTVNGVLMKDHKAEARGKPRWVQEAQDPLGDFERQVESLKRDSVAIHTGNGFTSTSRSDLGDRMEWVRSIDRIVRSKASKKVKKDKLRKLTLLNMARDRQLDLILKNWDGID